MKQLLIAADLCFSYGDRPALRNVSVSLEAGEIVAIIGPNGSGKSTLIKTLLGHFPAGGQILWQEKVLGDWRLRDLARIVAYLPQSPRHEAGQTVAEVLRLGRAARWGPFGLESSARMRRSPLKSPGRWRWKMCSERPWIKCRAASGNGSSSGAA